MRVFKERLFHHATVRFIMFDAPVMQPAYTPLAGAGHSVTKRDLFLTTGRACESVDESISPDPLGGVCREYSGFYVARDINLHDVFVLQGGML